VAAQADPVIQMGTPAFSGAGCRPGTASATLSPDNQALSVIYDSFQVEAGRAVRRLSHAKGCTVKIPLQVPPGYFVSLTRADYRGFNSTPQGGKTVLTVQQLMTSANSLSYARPQTYKFEGPQDEEYLVSSELQKSIRSRCGGKVNLILNTNLKTTTNKYRESALSTVDSMDVNASTTVVYSLQPCTR
jgi:hypothetical protein